ncbi:hypothetical protein ACM55I_13890 [Flavobacterium sp. GB2R13]
MQLILVAHFIEMTRSWLNVKEYADLEEHQWEILYRNESAIPQ